MMLMPLGGEGGESSAGLRLVFEPDESALLGQLLSQLVRLLQSHSGTSLDPDPLFAGLEVGGSETPPLDPALARLLPDAYEGDAEASEFRRVTEQGLVNRKLQDALQVVTAIGIGEVPFAEETVEVEIPRDELLVWARTLTALRLAIAARIGLERAEDHAKLASDEALHGTVTVFDWLAAILESIMQAARATADPPHPPAR